MACKVRLKKLKATTYKTKEMIHGSVLPVFIKHLGASFRLIMNWCGWCLGTSKFVTFFASSNIPQTFKVNKNPKKINHVVKIRLF